MSKPVAPRVAPGTHVPRRVLLISYAFPPLVNAQAIRWLMLVRQLVSRGDTVDVLTVRLPPYYEDLLDEIPAGVRIHRVPPGPIERLAFGAKARLRTERDWITTRRQAGALGVLRRLYNLVRRAADGVLVTDLCTEWFPLAAPRALALGREDRFDVVVSSFEPGVSHLLGWLVKRRVGLPWLADFGDPWVNQHTPAWRRRIDQSIGRRLIARMDVVTVTTRALADALERQSGHLHPVHVVPQGFDPDLSSAVAPERPVGSDKLSVVYTGTLYEDLRSPSTVLSALHLLRDRDVPVSLTIAGRVPHTIVDDPALRDLGDVVRFLGVVPHKRALALQNGADVLLHLDNYGTDLQEPGKFYEYLGAARPVLVVSRGAPGASAVARCLRALGCGRDVPADPESIAAALEAFDAERRDTGVRKTTKVPVEYSYARSAEILCNAIEQAIDRATSDRVTSRRAAG